MKKEIEVRRETVHTLLYRQLLDVTRATSLQHGILDCVDAKIRNQTTSGRQNQYGSPLLNVPAMARPRYPA